MVLAFRSFHDVAMVTFILFFANLMTCSICSRSGYEVDDAVEAMSNKVASNNSFTVHGPGRNLASLLDITARDFKTKQVDARELPTSTILADPENRDSVPTPILPTSFQQLDAAEADLSDLMRMSVVRIHSIVKPVDWFHPYFPAGNQESIGSGFSVEEETGKPNEDDPIFMTNAHVVRNAHTVQIQLPSLGQATFDAYVPLIYEDYDLAVVKLYQPQEFIKAIKAENKTLKILKIAQSHVTLGLEVLALGYPLGSSSLKLSRGVIAGTEQVHGGVCYQSTAPISPGNSGGPLFSLGSSAGEATTGPPDLTVIGVNFAASVSQGAENVNYVIPVAHLQQALFEYKKISAEQRRGQEVIAEIKTHLPEGATLQQDQNGNLGIAVAPNTSKEEIAKTQKEVKAIIEKATQGKGSGGAVGTPGNFLELSMAAGRTQPQLGMQGPPQHHRLRVAPIDLMGTEGNDALYKSSGGCTKGIYISKISGRSALQFAVDAAGKPSKVPEGSFLTAVNGIPLDNYGMGRTNGFLNDPLPFESIMGVNPSLEEPVKLTVCQQGTESEHTISMVWKDSYEAAIKAVTEPYFEPAALDYEYFADICIMQMTQNHLMALLQHGAATLGRWLLPEDQTKPRLVVVDIKPGSYASRNVMAGMVVDKVNGKNVSTLADYREAFEPGNATEYWTLATDRGLLIQQKFEETLQQQVNLAVQVPEFRYLVTPAVQKAAMARAAQDKGKQQLLANHEEQVKKAAEAIHNEGIKQIQEGRNGRSPNANPPSKLVSSPKNSFAELGPLLDQLSSAKEGIGAIAQHTALAGGSAIGSTLSSGIDAGAASYMNTQDSRIDGNSRIDGMRNIQSTGQNMRNAQAFGLGVVSPNLDGSISEPTPSFLRFQKGLI